jgi:hypothetical protein
VGNYYYHVITLLCTRPQFIIVPSQSSLNTSYSSDGYDLCARLWFMFTVLSVYNLASSQIQLEKSDRISHTLVSQYRRTDVSVPCNQLLILNALKILI